MRGLNPIPRTSDLESAFQELLAAQLKGLLKSESTFNVDKLSLWCQWSRFDPRLAEVLVQYFGSNWKTIEPYQLREASLTQAWPTAVAVVLENSRLLVPRTERKIHDHWIGVVTSGLDPASGEQFYIGIRAFAGTEMRRDAELAIKPFTRWGYLARSPMINKDRVVSTQRSIQTLAPKASRIRKLRELLKSRKRIRIEDYIEAIEGRVSLRQAQRDLKAFPGLIRNGRIYQYKN